MKKCVWKDGKFYPCDNFNPKAMRNNPGYDDYVQCKSCGCTIRKPEPEVIIRKSGGTWVARRNGVDWIYCDINTPKEQPIFFNSSSQLVHGWAKISEIEITDDIAKLRPMVIVSDGDLFKLFGVQRNYCIMSRYYDSAHSSCHKSVVRLATVSDLENLS